MHPMKWTNMKINLLLSNLHKLLIGSAILAALILTVCGAADRSAWKNDNSFTVSGTVSGITGTGLVLQNNSADDKTITANGSFTFTTA